MVKVVYRKTDLQLVGSVASNMTVEQEIELNVIPNFGGSKEDYDFIKTDKTNFHLGKDKDGNVIVIENPITPVVPEPTKEELQAEEIEKLKKQLATCQQSIVELTALAAMKTL